MHIIEKPFGTKANGENVPSFHCDNGNGLALTLMPLGASIVQIHMADACGNVAPICLGFPNLAGYEGPHPSFGSTVGRFCNRIANSAFSIDGTTHTLANNEGVHHIHGGPRGLGRQYWAADPFQTTSEVGVTFSIMSPAGDMGYPGNLAVKARYSLAKNNRLTVQFSATTDAPTHLNLTNHAYWHLAQETEKSIHQHQLQIDATHILTLDEDTIPNGDLTQIDHTAFDFRSLTTVGDNLSKLSEKNVGFDHCYTRAQGRNPSTGSNTEPEHNDSAPIIFSAPLATLKHPISGRCLSITSTQPGLQLYTSQFLSGTSVDANYPPFSGICLEPQDFPNAPNIEGFPTTRLNPDQTYSAEIVYNFWTA